MYLKLTKECFVLKKLTNEEFVMRMSQINSDIIFESKYINSRTKIKCRCKICDTVWEASGNALLSGTGCPHCAAVNKCLKSHDDFVQDLASINNFIKVIGEYKGSKSRIKCQCLDCNKIFETHPRDLLRGHLGHRCPVNHQVRNKSPQQFLKELQAVNSEILLLEDYVSVDNKILCRCKKCGFEWSANPSDLLNGHGCRNCNVSRGENAIQMYAREHNIEYVSQYSPSDCFYKLQLHFDVYFPQYNIIVEFDGRQHFEPITRWGGYDAFIDIKKRDEIKNQYCIDKGITMVRIPYWEYKNINKILDTYFD